MKTWPPQLRITGVRYLREFQLELSFSDGTIGTLDLAEQIQGRGGIMAPLENRAYFSQVRLNPDSGTIEWPNGVDLCPDVLYNRITGIPIPFAQQPTEIFH